MTDCALSQIFNVYDKVIMVQSSLEVIFFKEQEVLVDEEMVLRWKPYFTIPEGGLIDFIKGGSHVQVTGNETIDVWSIDKETLEP